MFYRSTPESSLLNKEDIARQPDYTGVNQGKSELEKVSEGVVKRTGKKQERVRVVHPNDDFKSGLQGEVNQFLSEKKKEEKENPFARLEAFFSGKKKMDEGREVEDVISSDKNNNNIPQA